MIYAQFFGYTYEFAHPWKKSGGHPWYIYGVIPRAGSSMRLVRLKPQGPGPNRYNARYNENLQSRTTLGPEISREKIPMAIESNLVCSLDFKSIINQFASIKARKAKL